jgi:hypothetical protein
MEPAVPEEEPLPDDILNASADDIMARTRLIDNDLKVSQLFYAYLDGRGTMGRLSGNSTTVGGSYERQYDESRCRKRARRSRRNGTLSLYGSRDVQSGQQGAWKDRE